MSVIDVRGEIGNLAMPEGLGCVSTHVYTPEGIMNHGNLLDGPVVAATRGEDPSWLVGMFPGQEYPDAVPSVAGVIRRGSAYEILHAHILKDHGGVSRALSGLFDIDVQSVVATVAENGEVVQPHVKTVGATCVYLYAGDDARIYVAWRREVAKLRRVEGGAYEDEWELAHSILRAMVLSVGRGQFSLVAPEGEVQRNRQPMFPDSRPFTRGVAGYR